MFASQFRIILIIVIFSSSDKKITEKKVAFRYGGGEEYFPNKPGEKPNNKSDDYNDGVIIHFNTVVDLFS